MVAGLKVAFSVLLLLQLAHAQSVLVNDGFEVNYDGWVASGDFTQIKAHPGLGYNMSRGMKITDRKTPSDGAISEKSFYLSGDEEYDYSVFVRHEGQANETFNLMLGSQVIASAVVPFGKWVELTAKYTAPQNPENLTISITTNSTADFIFDNFKVTQEEPEYPIFHAPYDNVGLKDIYAKHFRVGNILNGTTANNSGIRALVAKEYNSISMENEHKPDATMTRTNSTNTDIKAQINSGAAAAMSFCAQNNIPMRGHVLTWHGQTPDWFFIQDINDGRATGSTSAGARYRDIDVNQVPWATKAVMKQRLESYIKNLFALYQAQYPNVRFYAYDVTNEAFDGAGNMRPRGFDHNGAGGQTPSSAGNSPWQGVYGAGSTEWIEDAFTYARKYAPSYTKLFYNDFNEWDPPKRDGITSKVLTPLRDKKLLDGMGMQSHVSANPNDGWSGQTRHLAAMDHYANLNIEVQLTELDPSTNNGQYTSQQPGRYSAIFQKAIDINKRNVGKVTAICIWTPNDANTWLGTQHTPALHDASNNRKPAYDAVAQLVPQSDWGDGNNPTFDGGSDGGTTITIGCNVNGFAASYAAGAAVPRPNVTCSNGTPGTASFRIGENVITGWNSSGGTHALYNAGTRAITLVSLVCGSTTVTPSTPVSCGNVVVVAASSSSAGNTSSSSTVPVTATCNVNNLNASYTPGASIPRPNIDCSAGTPGTASFSIGTAAIDGWTSPSGTASLWNTGVRAITLSSVVCGSATVTLNPAASCGNVTIAAPNSSSSSDTPSSSSNVPSSSSAIPPDANGYFFHHTYEDGTTQEWVGRFGASSVTNTDAEKANGLRSLLSTDRTAEYHGPAYSLTQAFVPGQSYSFSVLAMYADGPDKGTFKFTLQYNLNGETIYGEIDLAEATKGSWVMLKNPSFLIPEGATNLVLYVEMPDNAEGNFYIDDAMGGVKDAVAPGIGGGTPILKTPSIVANSKSEIYNLKGNKVSGTLPSGVYIEKRQGMPSKIFVVK